jgi:hypothetical protein
LVVQGEEKTVSFNQLEQIEKRVGRTPSNRLQWALDFAQKDLDSLTPGQLEDLCLELRCFANTLIWWAHLPKYQQEKIREEIRSSASGRKIKVSVPQKNEVYDIQVKFKDILEGILKTGSARIGPIQKIYDLAIQIKGTEKKDSSQEFEVWDYFPTTNKSNESKSRRVLPEEDFRFDSEESFTGMALSSFGELLAGHTKSIGICPEEKCGKWFVASRLNQTYCCNKCQSRHATRVHRQQKKKKEIEADEKMGKRSDIGKEMEKGPGVDEI